MFLQNNHYIQNKRICSILITFTLKTSCVCVVFFRIYLDFFFFLSSFCFHGKGSSKSAERKALSSVLKRREERDEERLADDCGGQRRRRGGRGRRGLEYLCLFSLLLVLSPSAWLRLSGSRALRVKFLLLVWFLVGDGGLFGFLQCVAALILLLHPVHQQHDEEGGKQGAHHSSNDHR